MGEIALPPKASIPAAYLVGCIDLDQQDIGSCTSWAWKKAYKSLCNRKGSAFDPSPRFIYAEERTLEGTPLDHDDGAMLSDGARVLQEIGVSSEALCPYSTDAEPADELFKVAPSQDALDDAGRHKARLIFGLPDVVTIKAQIVEGYPVVFAFQVPNAINDHLPANGGDGLLTYPAPGAPFEGSHAVNVDGYDDSIIIGSDVGAVHVNNQWGVGCDFWISYRWFQRDPVYGALADEMTVVHAGEV